MFIALLCFQLMQVLAFFSVQARGPASGRYAEQLASECTCYWQAGRQMCEQISLTGHPCINRLEMFTNLMYGATLFLRMALLSLRCDTPHV